MIRNPMECLGCGGSGEIPRKDLPPMYRGPLAIGIRQNDECPVCDGTGYVEGPGREC